MNGFRKIASGVFVFAIPLTIFFGIYMAQPWGENYAYHAIEGYITLAGLLTLAISPYISFLFFPVVQWGAVAVLIAICLSIKWFGRSVP